MDKITLDKIKTAHPDLVAELNKIYADICEVLKGRVLCRFPYVLRTWLEQNNLFALGRTVKNPNGITAARPMGLTVTKAKGGESYHNYGLAVDIVLVIDKDGNGSYETASWDEKIDVDADGQSDWAEIVHIFKMYGWEWGGDWNNFRDAPHFQKTFDKSVKELQAMYNVQKTPYLTGVVK